MNHIQGKEEVIRFQKRSPESGWEVRVLGLLKNLTRREVGRKLTFQVSSRLSDIGPGLCFDDRSAEVVERPYFPLPGL